MRVQFARPYLTGDEGDAVAAVSVSGPMARIVDARVGPLSALVLQAARDISAEMGARIGP